MNAAVLIFDGFDELDLAGPFEVLGMAKAQGEDIDVQVVTREPQPTVRGIYGLTVAPTGVLDGHFYDLLVVVGGGWLAQNDVGAWGEVQRGDLPEAIASWVSPGRTVAGVCTGGMILSAAGLTRGRPATTHRGAIEALKREGAQLVPARVVDDGDLVTSGGVTAGIDLGLWLVERNFGTERAEAIADALEHERSRDVHLGGRGSLRGAPQPI